MVSSRLTNIAKLVPSSSIFTSKLASAIVRNMKNSYNSHKQMFADSKSHLFQKCFYIIRHILNIQNSFTAAYTPVTTSKLE